jgi:transcriptional regulator with GAF, ATPase, and Fis domain
MHPSEGDSTLQADAADPAGARARLTELAVLASPDASQVGRRFPLSPDEPVLLGRRVERGGIAIDDPRMSRVHARLSWDGRYASYRVDDAGSANGVSVDGQRSSSSKLAHASIIRVGNTVLAMVDDDPMAAFVTRLDRAASSELSALLLGETGCGKELWARELHLRSGRAGAFVPVNCAAMHSDLLSAELFGHTRAAFSGAVSERAGLFRAAHGGTLFLDEIGDMALAHQPALLRALQERTVRPVGSERELPVDVRIVAATHRDLAQVVATGAFRDDLLARLSQIELHVPPLRQRPHSLPGLMADLCSGLKLDVTVTADAMEALAIAPWRHNVRELAALLARLQLFGEAPYELNRAFLDAEAPHLTFARTTSVAPAKEGPVPEPDLGDSRAPSRESLEAAFAGGARSAAEVARELGTSRTQVYRWLKRFGMKVPSERSG